MKKIRLDDLLLQSKLCDTLDNARRLIIAGEVSINGNPADKAGSLYPVESKLLVKEKCPYVSRGGYKLAGGLRDFPFSPEGLICLDVGASSGGFTDCLLQNGAKKVYAVDVAYGMLDWKLRQDTRVMVIERFNARKITTEQVPEKIDLAVIDAAFISLTKLIPPLIPLFGELFTIICLVKPQFELPRNLIPKGGVITDPEHHKQAVEKIRSFAKDMGLNVSTAVKSSILGPKGNIEFLLKLSSLS
ncbi:MAG: TlyA family rRNA (cytidine-2'-O)-methyltransferase [Desulfocapsa sp.]|nr:MAG: TlyA family rRNA (cytidine-2'-O)-methyltransferase [Desulfocapsa sp.]